MNVDINLINNIKISGHVLIAGPLFSGKSMLMTKLADKYAEKSFDSTILEYSTKIYNKPLYMAKIAEYGKKKKPK